MDPPNSGRKKRNKDETDPYEKAADALWNAEFIVIIAGPSFCEDSSKTAFSDERCNPKLIAEPNKFYGFWGQFYNRYNDKHPHDGFSILRKWRDQFFDAFGIDVRKRMKGIPKKLTKRDDDGEGEGVAGERILQRCYIVTSNVDGFFTKAGFREDETYEMCGNINQWQCSIPCKAQLWSLDHFRFEIDPVLKEAKPIKYVEDTRSEHAVERWDIVDEDAEPYVNTKPDKKEEDMTEKERMLWKQTIDKKTIARLHRVTVVPLLVEYQIHPTRYYHWDHFTATPSTSYEAPQKYTFPELDNAHSEKSDDYDEEDTTTPRDEQSAGGSATIGAGVGQGPAAPPLAAPSAVVTKKKEEEDDIPPEQVYILKKRVSHHLAHMIALLKNQYVYHEGVFTLCDPEVERVKRKEYYAQQQKFFEEKDTQATARRQKHIMYNISVYVQDVDKPDYWSEENFEESHRDEILNMTMDAAAFPMSPMGTTGAMSPTFGGTMSLSVMSPVGSGYAGAKGILGVSTTVQSQAASTLGATSTGQATPATGASSPLHPPTTPQHPTLDPAVTLNSPSLTQLEVPRPDDGNMSSAKSHASHMSNADWTQGDGGRYFFSYVPIEETLADPWQVRYDHLKISFPNPGEEFREDLPRRGRVSVVVECVILPEPNEEPKETKKKKKKRSSGQQPKPPPIEEPTKYVAFQLVGRLDTRKKDKRGASSGSVLSAQSGQSRSTVDNSSHSKHTQEDDDTIGEYRIQSNKGHVLKLGVSSASRRTLQYIGLEIPTITPTTQHVGVRREAADSKPTGYMPNSEFQIYDSTSYSRNFQKTYDQQENKQKNSKGKSKKKPRPVPNHQLCQSCKDTARPHVLMCKQDIRCMPISKRPYMSWERAMLEDLKLDGAKTIVIFELGCEKKTDQCHKHAERLYKLTKNSQRSTLIRVSRTPVEQKKSGFGQGTDSLITITENVVIALGNIDRYLLDRTRRK